MYKLLLGCLFSILVDYAGLYGSSREFSTSTVLHYSLQLHALLTALPSNPSLIPRSPVETAQQDLVPVLVTPWGPTQCGAVERETQAPRLSPLVQPLMPEPGVRKDLPFLANFLTPWIVRRVFPCPP